MNRIVCEGVRDRYSELYEEELSSELALETAAHLAACDGCRDGYREFSERLEALRTLPRHPVPRAYGQGVVDRIQAAAAGRRAGPGRASSVSRNLAWAAALILAAGVLWRVDAYRMSQFSSALSAEWRSASRELAQALDSKSSAEARAREQESERVRAELATYAVRALELERALSSLTNAFREAIAARSEGANDALIAELRVGLEDLRASQRAAAEKLAVLSQFESGLESHERQLTAFAHEADRRWDQIVEQIAELRVVAETRIVATRAPEPARRPLAGEPPIADAPLAIKLGDAGTLRLVADLADPQAINSLFELYATGDNELKALALELLDERFRGELVPQPEREAAARPKRGGILGVFANDEAPPAPVDLAAKRMAFYRELWRAKSYGGGAPPRW